MKSPWYYRTPQYLGPQAGSRAFQEGRPVALNNMHYGEQYVYQWNIWVYDGICSNIQKK